MWTDLIVYQQAEIVIIIENENGKKAKTYVQPNSTINQSQPHTSQICISFVDTQGHDVSNSAGQMFQLCTTCVEICLLISVLKIGLVDQIGRIVDK